MTMIYVVTNALGDVIALYDKDGNAVVKYEYDAWGNIISVVNSTEGSNLDWNEVNPFRYRGYYYDAETGLYYLNSRYYDSETGRFLNADDTSVINATPNALTDKNLFSYCDNNPVMREDNGGAFWDIVLDVVSIVASAIEVVKNPDDVGAWVGLALDVVDVAIPTGGGLGEAYDAYRVYDKGKDALRYSDNVADVVKHSDEVKKVSNATRSGAVRKAWKNEYINVKNGGTGISRDWTPSEIEELLARGKVKGYNGHHMKNVHEYPDLAGDPNNIQFLTRREHLAAHGGNWRNPTHGYYDYRLERLK